VTQKNIPSKALMGFWNRLVKKAKKAQSDARASALRTGGGNSDAQPIDDTTAQILSIGQTEVRFQNQGKFSLLIFNLSIITLGRPQKLSFMHIRCRVNAGVIHQFVRTMAPIAPRAPHDCA
jgi:hypothetical protein